MKKIYIGSDHAAFSIKEKIKEWFKDIQFEDVGTKSTESCNYPEYAIAVAKKVQSQDNAKGILICGSGVGMSIVANRFKKVRAALCRSIQDAQLSRAHNNANILCLGARVNSEQEIKEIITTWLASNYEGGRHQQRIDLFDQLGE